MPGRVLVVEDEREMRAMLEKGLTRRGFTPVALPSADEALVRLAAEDFDVVLTDLRMPGMDGLALCERIALNRPDIPVVVVTAFGSLETAVAAIRAGAYDFVTKPIDVDALVLVLERAVQHRALREEVRRLRQELGRREDSGTVVGESPAMKQAYALIDRVADLDSTVLITGESGTGKEVAARAVHTRGRRKDGPFVAINCAAMPEALLESELFGHAKGAFTGAVKSRRGLFEEADGGTLFIDEVTETSPTFQSKLLRALQEGEVRRVGESTALRVDVRIVAATNRDIELEVRDKRFRQDLYYRLNVVALRVPPLRERLEDVPALAEHFLERANARSPNPKRLSAAAVSHLMSYGFPGNVRELENLVEQAAALAEGDELLPEDFPVRQGRMTPAHGTPSVAFLDGQGGALGRNASAGPTLAQVVEEAERHAITQALERHGVDLARVADELGVSSTTLWRKMKRLNLRPPSELARE